MAIKLTVNYVDLKLTIDTDSAEAVSTFVFAKSTVSYVNLTNTLAYTDLTAADVLTDADSKNMWLSPEYDYWGLDESGFLISMSDATALATALAKTETATMEEELAKAISKPDITDSATLSELLTKVVQYFRTFSDSYGMSDAIDSVDTSLVKIDTTTLSEATAKLASLGKTDTATLSEALANAFSRPDTDAVTLSEALANAFSRPDTDAVTLAEADIKTFGLGKTETTTLSEAVAQAIALAKTETPTMSDVFSRAVIFVRSFTDAYTLDDTASATDVLQTDSTLVKGNIFTISETQATSVSKPAIIASVSMQETSALAFSSPETDSLSLSEAKALAMSLGKTETATMTEAIDSFAVNPAKSDSVTVSDSPVLGFSIPFSDGPTLSEQAALAAALAKTETFTLSEGLVDSFSKIVTDSATITESVSVLFIRGYSSMLNTAALNTTVLN